MAEEMRWGATGDDVPYEIKKFNDEDAWRSGRRIGASTSPIIMGASQWGSPLQVWGELKGLILPSFTESEPMKWGKILEEPIANEFAKRTGAILIDHGRTTIHASKEHPFLTCSLDREIVDWEGRGPGVLEIKAVGGMRKDEWDEDAPLNYQIQVQHQLAIMGPRYTYGVLCALVGGQDLRWIIIPRHEPFIQTLVGKCKSFWDSVGGDTPPLADGSKATGDALRAMFKKDSGGSIALPPESVFWAEEIEECNKIIAEATDRKGAIQNKVMEAIGQNTFGLLPDGRRYSWKLSERKGYTVEPSTTKVLRLLKK